MRPIALFGILLLIAMLPLQPPHHKNSHTGTEFWLPSQHCGAEATICFSPDGITFTRNETGCWVIQPNLTGNGTDI